MPNPTQADLFRRFQVHIWQDEWPSSDPNARIWDDAQTGIQVLGGRKTGDKKEHDGSLVWEEWLLPDGSLVEILSDGSGVDEPSSGCSGIYRQDQEAEEREYQTPLASREDDIQFLREAQLEHLVEKVKAAYERGGQ